MIEGIEISTLGDLRRLGYRLNGFCRVCGKNGDLDLDALIARFGRGHSYIKGAFTLRCSCGAVANYHLDQPIAEGR